MQKTGVSMSNNTKDKPNEETSATYNAVGIEELKGYNYTGSKLHNQYNQTTKAIADYCGSRMLPGVWELIMYGTEAVFTAPEEPKGKATEYSKVRFSREVEQWLKDKKEYDWDKLHIFIIIHGQCLYLFRNAVEEHDTFGCLAAKSNVVGLLVLIRELTYNTTVATQYGPG
jgi:hypothetical protein